MHALYPYIGLVSSNIEWALPLPTAKVFSTNVLTVPTPPEFSPTKVICYKVVFVITTAHNALSLLGLYKLIKKCDKRISAKKTTKHGFVRKKRKAGIPSKQEVPENAPLWAIKQVTTPKGMYKYMCISIVQGRRK